MTLTDAHAELVEWLDQRVRALVRHEGVDPQRDALVVRRIAESVVREHDERSLTGAVAPVHDVDSVVGELVARGSGVGPPQPFLDGSAVEEIRPKPQSLSAAGGAMAWSPVRRAVVREPRRS